MSPDVEMASLTGRLTRHTPLAKAAAQGLEHMLVFFFEPNIYQFSAPSGRNDDSRLFELV